MFKWMLFCFFCGVMLLLDRSSWAQQPVRVVHRLSSKTQSRLTDVHVLLPAPLRVGATYRTLYLLPVEKRLEKRYGDVLREIQRLDLHNRHQLICVYPTFAELPWYADHPSRLDRQQEKYLLHTVIPLVEERHPVSRNTGDRLLLGFSKSGWGACSLILRHPQRFGAALAWDAPLTMSRPGLYGSGPIFGSPANFRQYQLTRLIGEVADEFRQSNRLAIIGYDNFRQEHLDFHETLKSHGVLHTFRDGPQRKHHWESGWVEEAVEILAGEDQ